MRILHTADWHIGSFKGPEKDGVNLRSEDTIKCLRHMVSIAQDEKPDLVLVSGDLFHQASIWEDRSHKELHIAREIIKKLAECAGEVIVMRGTPNHDAAGIFLSLTETFEKYENIKIVTTPEVVTTEYADVVVIPGFDKGYFRSKHPGISKEDENVIFTEELGKMVAGLRTMCGTDVPAILMGHCTIPGCNTESGQTQFLTQFEPVITQDMLLAANYDLVAMGHIHRPQKINGPRNVYYSGAINQMNFNDEGQERGFWTYDMDQSVDGKWEITNAEFHKTPYREHITFQFTDTDITAINYGNIEQVAFNYWTYNGAATDKIVRVRYTCSAEQNKIFNKAFLEKALYDAGAFYVSGIEPDKIESANQTELSKQENPETNLIQFLQEKLIEPAKIDSIVARARPIIQKALSNSSTSEFFGTFVPKEIEVKNYRNYVEQYFSFEDISFCTINGANGAGKSSLFMDAIIDCLYEEPREGTNTGWIRNDEKARSGSISFTFGLGDKTFRVVRTRTKSGKPTLNISEFVNGEWEDRSKEKVQDTQKEIVKILGMDSLTFKACVLIMQDQYGLFLEAGKEERVGVLSNLLGLGIYGLMEDITKTELLELKREIAQKKNSINIHNETISAYGNPEEKLAEVDRDLTIASAHRSELTRQREDKSLLLRIQQEAEERRYKVKASVAALEQKKTATEANIRVVSDSITGCEIVLASEPETMEKVEQYNTLVEQDKELVKAAVAYQAKADELVRNHNQEGQENATVAKIKADILAKHDEMNRLILESANDGEVKAKAAEYEEANQELEAAKEQEKRYREVEKEISDARVERSSICSMYETKLKGMESKLESLQKRAELLKNVDCVDIENAKCGFLADAQAAKQELETFPQMIAEKKAEYEEKLAPADEKLVALRQKLKEMPSPLENVMISAKCDQLRPYVDKLAGISQRESQIALIRSTIDNMQSNLLEAEKRLSEVKLKGTEIEQEMISYKEQAEKHREVEQEMSTLMTYVEKAKTFPVIKERKKNAESQMADIITRLAEIEQDLSAARKELEETSGATMDIPSIRSEVDVLTQALETESKKIAEYQQLIGSYKQKIEETEKLRLTIKTLQNEVGDLSQEISEYELLKIAFSQDGIPHQIIRSLVPKLTEISSNILGQMTGGKMGIEFQTEKVLKSNSNKEVVTLDIYIEEYGKSVLPYLSKSGGEKVKASLSVILALAEIKSSAAGIQLGMLFIDEPPFLDGDGVQSYCDALETIQSRYPNLKIMAVTHDPTMKARFPQSLDVVKTDEGSKVIF